MEGLAPFLRRRLRDQRYISRQRPCSAPDSEVPCYSLPFTSVPKPSLPAAVDRQLSSRHPGTKTPRRVEEPQSSAAIPSSFRGGDLVSRTACLRPSQKPSLSYPFVSSSCKYLDRISRTNTATHISSPSRQWLSAHAPRPSSGAPATTTTPSPRPTPQILTSDGPAMFTSPASPCRGPNTGHHRRRSTKSISTRSASPTLGDARVSRANIRPWALEHLADSPVQPRAGGAAGTAGRRA